MTTQHRLLLAALTAALASCGTVQTTVPGGPAPTASSPVVTAEQSLVTVSVPAHLTREQLQAATPDASILSFHPETGTAILAVTPPRHGTLNAQGLQSQALTALGAEIEAVEPNYEVAVQSTDPETMGLTTWAGGLTTWAGGLTTWAGGAGGMDSAGQAAYGKFLSRIAMSSSYIATMPTQGTGVKVAVLDTGVDMNHPFLKTQISTTQGWDYIGNDAVPQEVAPTSGVSRYGHGTAVTGVLLQVAPKVTVLPYRVLGPDGSGTVGNLVLAIDRAVADGANVINVSLGLTSDSTALSTSISNALNAGVVIAAAAGNSNSSTLMYPARYATNGGLLTAPKFVGLVSVGSINFDGSKSSFSNYSSDLQMSAPGNGVVTAYPGGRLVYASGTSFATPAVAGALALGRYRGTLTVSSLTEKLVGSADAYNTLDLISLNRMGRLLNVPRYLANR